MDDEISIQQQFFTILKKLNFSQLSFVHTISELLGISYDSAYRRIRGDKPLNFREIILLAEHFNISLDEFIQADINRVQFEPFSLEHAEDGFRLWLDFMLKELRLVQISKRKEIIYAARDIPIFYYFDFPDLIAFKFYLWQKMLISDKTTDDQHFDISLAIHPYLSDLGNRILASYTLLPSTELWNYETFNGVLHQMEYSWISGFFNDKDAAIQLCSSLDSFIHHMQKQVSLGIKFRVGTEPANQEPDFNVYLNEVFLSDNTVLVGTDHNKRTIITYNTLNLLKTDDPGFFDQVEHSWKTLMKSATLISNTSARERNHFFALLHERILHLEEMIRKA